MSFRSFPPRVNRGAFRLLLAWSVTLAFALVWLGGCARGPKVERRVVAILPTEYLGADAEHQWMASAIGAAIAEQVRGAKAASIFIARDANDAAARAATEVLRTVVTGEPSNAELTMYRERPATRKVEVLQRSTAPSPEELLTSLRQGLEDADLAGIAFSTSSGEAFIRFGKALAARSRDDADVLLAEALKADPRFTGASLRLASSLARAGNLNAAQAELDRLLRELPEDRAMERAFAKLEMASLRSDRVGVLQALEEAVAAAPGDADARSQLALTQMQAKRFDDAARNFEILAQTDPTNTNYWNQAIYAFTYAGKRADAVRLLEPYRRAAPKDANVDDSAGDMEFFFSRFSEAAERYTAAYETNPKLLGGFSMFKAGWAWLYAGELMRADEAMERFVGELRQQNAPLADLRSAQWQYLRGRRQEARSAAEAMRRQESQYGAGFTSLVASQLYLWDVARRGVRAIDLRAGGGSPYGLSVRPTVAALAQVARPGLTSGERAQAIAQVVPVPQQVTLVAVATYLDAQREGNITPEALATFQVADAATAESRGMTTHLLLGWALAGSGQHEEALRVFARRVPPVAEDDGLLWPLVIPQSLQWEKEAAEAAGKPSSIEKLDALVNVLVGGASE
ncbi:MAG: tetratricopeptide repeat protein [Bryobacterales bacterium]|nr:tetratricopeptide repeat protein [Bryobacterales bacterium]